jgi:hypothetical protein
MEEAAHMVASLILLQIISVDLMRPADLAKQLTVQLAIPVEQKRKH